MTIKKTTKTVTVLERNQFLMTKASGVGIRVCVRPDKRLSIATGHPSGGRTSEFRSDAHWQDGTVESLREIAEFLLELADEITSSEIA